jgi:hypothetical protein
MNDSSSILGVPMCSRSMGMGSGHSPANNAVQHKAFDMEHCKLPKRFPKLNLVWTLLHGVNPLVHLEREE